MATTSYLWTTHTPFTANTITQGDQVEPAVASNAAGTAYLAVWHHNPNTAAPVNICLVTGDSVPVGDQSVVSDGGGGPSSVAGLSDGRFVVTYTDKDHGDPGGDIRAMIVDANGSPVPGTGFVVAGGNADQTESDVVGLADGGYVVTWMSGPGNGDIHAQVRNADGSVRAAAVTVHANGVPATRPSVAALADGGFVVAWEEAVSPGVVRFQRFDADGSTSGFVDANGVLIDNVGTINNDIQVLGLPDGGFVVAYTDNGWNNGANTDVTARIYNADGTARNGPYFIRVNAAENGGVTAGNQSKPSLALLSNDHFAVGWSNGSDFLVQAFDLAGNAVGSNTPVMASIVEGEIAGLGAGRLGFVGQSEFSDGSGGSIRSTVFQFSRQIVGDNASDLIKGVGDSLAETLFGLGGSDWLGGGAGPDRLVGGAGIDTAFYVDAPAGVVASLADPTINTGDAKGDTYDSIENLTGSLFDDTLAGDGADNKLLGMLGNDRLHAGAGNDDIDGGEGEDTAWFGFDLGQHRIQDFHKWMIVTGPDGTDKLWSIENLEFADAKLARIDEGNPMFDALYYFSSNPDVFHAGINALDHFNAVGWHEGRDPNGYFDTSGYLAAYPDVAASGMNPLDHYHQIGWKEGRDPGANFDTTLYLLRNPDVAAAGIDPLAHFLANGMAEGRAAYQAIGNISGGFDAQYYLFHNPDVAAAGVDPLFHYNVVGWKEGRDPNAWFDSDGYLAYYTDVAAGGINPLQHYEAIGWKEGRDASARFDTAGYLAANPDVAAAGMNPLDHFLQFGIYEGRQAVEDGMWG